MNSRNPFSLEGKRILVTGASSGIGRAIAISCSKMGAYVFLTGRSDKRLQETFGMLSGIGHQIHLADLIVQDELEQLVSVLPTLDGVVHNAGVGSRIPCKQIVSADIINTLGPNFCAPVLLQASLLSHKKISKHASVVFIASRAADAPSVGNAIYSASKGAILSYAKVLALELAPRSIRVNSICPAMVWTELILSDGISKEELEIAQLRYPLKRYGRPEDIAYLAVYLLSDASGWMTGSSLDITGGAKEL